METVINLIDQIGVGRLGVALQISIIVFFFTYITYKSSK